MSLDTQRLVTDLQVDDKKATKHPISTHSVRIFKLAKECPECLQEMASVMVSVDL